MVDFISFLHGAQRVGFVGGGKASLPVGLAVHDKLDDAAVGELAVGDVELRIGFAVDANAFYISVFVAHARCLDLYYVPVLQMHTHVR